MVSVKFLHPEGPSKSFSFPTNEDVVCLPHNDVLTTVSPQTATGRTYALTEKEMKAASEVLNIKLLM